MQITFLNVWRAMHMKLMTSLSRAKESACNIQRDKLKNLPAPEIAVRYYTEGDLYLFAFPFISFQMNFKTARAPKSRRPKIGNNQVLKHNNGFYYKFYLLLFTIFSFLSENLYDVFLNIRDDEAEHCKTMKPARLMGISGLLIHILRMPLMTSLAASCLKPDCEGIVDCIKKSVSSH
ncbi:Ubiquinol oxidase 4, chloroplastic/chromoplastic [Vitis vinifera]|uniref:Ubiquinol oxidase n=1 Tax=Vitis vinifera TaxID=29760 RepID=A0A438JGF3_VITVI|nr:Ubiquinol oxidase 4, chloroplastic/chromoplastic [Vitis vinifera]